MITTSSGSDVGDLFDRVSGRIDRYSEIGICSPFLDDLMVDRLLDLTIQARRSSCALRVITLPAAAAVLRERLPGHPARWSRLIRVVPQLHAKVYMALAGGSGRSEGIVTSANLTWAGIAQNVELGIKAVSTSEPGRALLREISHFIRLIDA